MWPSGEGQIEDQLVNQEPSVVLHYFSNNCGHTSVANVLNWQSNSHTFSSPFHSCMVSHLNGAGDLYLLREPLPQIWRGWSSFGFPNFWGHNNVDDNIRRDVVICTMLFCHKHTLLLYIEERTQCVTVGNLSVLHSCSAVGNMVISLFQILWTHIDRICIFV